jgi:hypothetical protein
MLYGRECNEAHPNQIEMEEMMTENEYVYQLRKMLLQRWEMTGKRMEVQTKARQKESINRMLKVIFFTWPRSQKDS